MKVSFIKMDGNTLKTKCAMNVIFNNDGTDLALAVNHFDGAITHESIVIPFTVQTTPMTVPHLYPEEFCQVFRKEIDIVGPSTSGDNLINADAEVFKLVKDSNA